MRKYIIYKITNPIGEVYIGCTTDLERRKWQYSKSGNNIKGQRLIFESIKEYGYENHFIQILYSEICDDTEAQSLEMFWVRTLMTNKNRWPEMNGLNLTDGGKGALGPNKARKNKKRPKWICDKMSEGCINKKAIIQLDLNGGIIAEHESIRAAADFVKGARTSIHRVINGVYGTYKGYIFKYKQ